MPLRLTVALSEDLTWGELIGFVDAARPYVQDRDRVEIVNRESETDHVPDFLAVDLQTGASPRVSLTTIRPAPFALRFKL